MTFFRSREQRMADRRYCEQFMDDEADTFESFGHGLVIACAIGALVYVIVAGFVGWLA